jgi:hypothetical protein
MLSLFPSWILELFRTSAEEAPAEVKSATVGKVKKSTKGLFIRARRYTIRGIFQIENETPRKRFNSIQKQPISIKYQPLQISAVSAVGEAWPSYCIVTSRPMSYSSNAAR